MSEIKRILRNHEKADGGGGVQRMPLSGDDT